jgi:NTP pyrophosphatase (non-canonical NTP hydrolase)
VRIKDLVAQAHANSVAKGFYDPPPTFAEQIALCHSELSEALEDYRKGMDPATTRIDRSTPTPKPEGIPSELADVVIRIADMCGRYGIDLEAAIEEKMRYNALRPYRHGGKKL